MGDAGDRAAILSVTSRRTAAISTTTPTTTSAVTSPLCISRPAYTSIARLSEARSRPGKAEQPPAGPYEHDRGPAELQFCCIPA